ncbi:uncharacterized protein LOC116801117 isoform X2 [Drosophila sechellia]|uniref:uncharacterized protein LOC116801117 isoform X2 n=1 Tax=Drosophila sechellia TaxID=7238 RepID=UPI0013DDAB77|nr:uncharacterized protein LOC116801117 isoform X2 [Drosophila sechellia]
MHHIIPGLSPADLRLLLLCWPMLRFPQPDEPQQPAAPPPPAPALALPRQTFSDSNSDVWASPWLHFCFGLCGVNNAPTAGEMEEHTKEEARPEARSWIPTADQAR